MTSVAGRFNGVLCVKMCIGRIAVAQWAIKTRGNSREKKSLNFTITTMDIGHVHDMIEGRVRKRPFGKIEWSLYCHFSVIIVRHTCFKNSNGNEFNIIIICFLWTLKPFLFVEIIMLWTALFFLVLHYMLCVLLFTSKTRTSSEKGVFTFKICLSTHPSFISQRGTLLGLFKVKANSK